MGRCNRSGHRCPPGPGDMAVGGMPESLSAWQRALSRATPANQAWPTVQRRLRGARAGMIPQAACPAPPCGVRKGVEVAETIRAPALTETAHSEQQGARAFVILEQRYSELTGATSRFNEPLCGPLALTHVSGSSLSSQQRTTAAVSRMKITVQNRARAPWTRSDGSPWPTGASAGASLAYPGLPSPRRR